MGSAGPTGDPEGGPELRAGRLHAHGGQGDGVRGRAGAPGGQEHIGSDLAGDAEPRHLQGEGAEPSFLGVFCWESDGSI